MNKSPDCTQARAFQEPRGCCRTVSSSRRKQLTSVGSDFVPVPEPQVRSLYGQFAHVEYLG